MADNIVSLSQLRRRSAKARKNGSGERRSSSRAIQGVCDELKVFRSLDGRVFFEHPSQPGRAMSLQTMLPDYIRVSLHDRGCEQPSDTTLRSAVRGMEARARFGDDEREVFTRTGGHPNDYYLDLGDAFIRIHDGSWELTDRPSVVFKTTSTREKLPHPERGGSLDSLRPFVNVGSDDEFLLIVVYAAYICLPRKTYPILVLSGEHASGKSTLAEIIQSVVDGRRNHHASLPSSEHDLAIAATEGYVLCFDNLSGVSRAQSDQLCRIATGGTFATRKKYTDDEQIHFDVVRPMLLTGIGQIAQRADLVSRSILIEMPYLPDSRRLWTEAELWAEFESRRGSILGSILDLVARAAQRQPTIRPRRLARMAEFVQFGEAVASVLGLAEGTFLRAYEENRDRGARAALDSDPLTVAIQSLMAECGSFDGTATELLAALGNHQPPWQCGFPRDPRTLSERLRRAAPDLRRIGIEIDFSKSGLRTIRIWLALHQSSPACATQPPTEERQDEV